MGFCRIGGVSHAIRTGKGFWCSLFGSVRSTENPAYVIGLFGVCI